MSPPRQTEVASPVVAALAQLEQDQAAAVAAYDTALPVLIAFVESFRTYERSVERVLRAAAVAATVGTLPAGVIFDGIPPFGLDPNKRVTVGDRTVTATTNVAARTLDGLIAAARTQVGVHPVPRGIAPLSHSFIDGLRGSG